jgi:hypothetical protein
MAQSKTAAKTTQTAVKHSANHFAAGRSRRLVSGITGIVRAIEAAVPGSGVGIAPLSGTDIL